MRKPTRKELTVAEFFAGIGLARMGLEAVGFDVVWSNDFDRDKVRCTRVTSGRPTITSSTPETSERYTALTYPPVT